MFAMHCSAVVIIQPCVTPQTDLTDKVIQTLLVWNQTVVHGVMGNNKKTCVNVAANQNHDRDHNRVEVVEVQAKTNDQGCNPGGSNQTPKQQPLIKSSSQLFTWHPVSAALQVMPEGRLRRNKFCRFHPAGNARRHSFRLRGRTMEFVLSLSL